MQCLKCGKKTTDEQTFCDHCLEIMEDYPVKPDVHVQLPNRSTAAVPKKPKRRVLSADELVPVLKKRLRRMALALIVLALLLGLSVALHFIVKPNPVPDETGKNYTFINPFN